MKRVFLKKNLYQNFLQLRTRSSKVNFTEIFQNNQHEKLEKVEKSTPLSKKENLKISSCILKNHAPPYLEKFDNYGLKRKVYFETYGCQMNVNDAEIVWSILKSNGFLKTDDALEADVVLILTCAIRDSAEAKIWTRLNYFKSLKKKKGFLEHDPFFKVGILGCMAERLKTKLLDTDKMVDLVAGPDSYKDLPRLLALTENNQTAINVLLSLDETYADVMPVRLNGDSKTAFVSIMRGCDNMCAYCIVPFTRGKERSRPLNSILDEIKKLSDDGVKEVTLLGQNVNSYRDLSNEKEITKEPMKLTPGFNTVYKTKVGGLHFADLLYSVAEVNPEMRIRFTSPHPKDFPDEVLQAISEKPNICKSIHLPAQSGNTNVLSRMRRGYTREAYLDLITHIRSLMPEVALSSDFICGFCGETEEEFQDTLSLMEIVKYNIAYLFPYSLREKTTAHRRYLDDVPYDVKLSRLKRMVTVFRKQADTLNRAQIGRNHLVLVEGKSKRSDKYLYGRNDGNVKVIFPKEEIPQKDGDYLKTIEVGDYIAVQINNSTSQVLKGIPLYRTTLVEYYKEKKYPKCDTDYLKYASFM